MNEDKLQLQHMKLVILFNIGIGIGIAIHGNTAIDIGIADENFWMYCDRYRCSTLLGTCRNESLKMRHFKKFIKLTKQTLHLDYSWTLQVLLSCKLPSAK